VRLFKQFLKDEYGRILVGKREQKIRCERCPIEDYCGKGRCVLLNHYWEFAEENKK